MKTVEQYRIFEYTMPGTRAEGTFRQEGTVQTVSGYACGDGKIAVRFMPETTGRWEYRIVFDGGETVGSILCTPAAPENHGPVRAKGMHMEYADGTRFLSFGTTCYGWIHQPDELRRQTLRSLAASPFNKIRMLLFPKFMPYNNTEPVMFPFQKNEAGEWDVSKPNYAFWDDLDTQLLALDELGIEADLILFHPYDRWGFDAMSREENLTYLRYCVSRLGAYKNIWWSLANEYDMTPNKTEADWDAFGELVSKLDGGRHLLSIHNCCQVYPDRDWMTHCSIQSSLCRRTLTWGWQYRKPVSSTSAAMRATSNLAGEISPPLKWFTVSGRPSPAAAGAPTAKHSTGRTKFSGGARAASCGGKVFRVSRFCAGFWNPCRACRKQARRPRL